MNTNVEQAYNKWAQQYDTNINRTRDLEAVALRETLADIEKATILEIGCGTGKNSEWLINRAAKLVGVDLSSEMLEKAKQKMVSTGAEFIQADITREWNFVEGEFDLVTFSLVLEHIQNLDFIFNQAASRLRRGGHVYVGELHPFKQYTGSKARFETENGLEVVDCFTHHISDFTEGAKRHGLILSHLKEYFDDNDRSGIPRILTLLFTKA